MYVCNLAMYYILCIYGLLSEINSYIYNQIYVCVEHAVFLEINNYYLCISISENTTGGLTLSHNSVFVPS